ncbi:MAG: N,N-dimethylformamidase beta subunit family domain-containing protein [Hyphomicrobiaceae bacterium]
MTPLAAYADRLSVRPGERITFHGRGSCGVLPIARIVRVINADPNPQLGGVRTVPVCDLAGVTPLTEAPLATGSCAVVETAAQLGALDCVTITAVVWLRKEDRKDRAVVSVIGTSPEPTGAGLTLGISVEGRPYLSLAANATAHRLDGALEIEPLRWHLIWATYDSHSGAAEVGCWPIGHGRRASTGPVVTGSELARCPLTGRDRIVIAGTSPGVDPLRFTGRIERPAIFDRVLSLAEVMHFDDGGVVEGLVAAWDFARDMSSDRIVDRGPNGLHGRLINAPTRAVRGRHWTGAEMAWRHAPDHYAAIHFHDDDIETCDWPEVVAFDVPQAWPSGQYALTLEAEGVFENVPFWVVPRAGAPTARIAVLVSTFTYTVYGNHARPEWMLDPAWRDAWRAQVAEWAAYPHNPGDHRELGLSTYNVHADGSGIAMASWHRPMLNLRLGYLTYPYPAIRGSGLRHYPADSHLTQWLEAEGHEYDVITDWELHHEGFDLLSPYSVLLTGTHPEYHTREMLDALEAYRDGGGRIAYLGGNGFYWKIALSPTRDGVVEIRRAEGGIRAWAAEPGEYYNQFDGEYGGLWRRNGRAPQDLVGVGFSAQGNFVGSHYRIHPGARATRAGWILNGVSGDTFGGHGFSGHGAAGFELDRADKMLGTPAHAVTLASSEGHEPEAPWVLVPEERLTHLTTVPGQKDSELIRADLVFFETAGGRGAVFSTGSITWCGSLPTDGFNNDVARITGNVVRRFLDPEPFV